MEHESEDLKKFCEGTLAVIKLNEELIRQVNMLEDELKLCNEALLRVQAYFLRYAQLLPEEKELLAVIDDALAGN